MPDRFDLETGTRPHTVQSRICQRNCEEPEKRQRTVLLNKFESILTALGNNENLIRCLKLNREKGAGSWLTVLPLQDQGYILNKQEFKDAICLRYGWKISNTPLFCGCGKKNDVNHSLICAKGGYVYAT